MKLKLARIVSVYFHPIFEGWRSWSLNIGDAEIKTLGIRENQEGKLNLMITAETPIPSTPVLTADKKITIPAVSVSKAQRAIETAVNLLSVSRGAKRNISSPMPYVALIAEDEDAKIWLDNTNGLDIWTQALPKCNVRIDLEDQKILTGLIDRLDGVELMAEALAHEHVTGQFHEFMRLFERAFKRNRNGLINPLTKFLDKPYYTTTEIKKWVSDIRNPATHANKNSEFLIESDIRPSIEIIKQAAFDVLLNKEKWYDESSARRNFFMFDTKVIPGDTSLRIRQGISNQHMDFQLLDGLSAYPMDLSARFNNLPVGYWAKMPKDIKSRTFLWDVVPAGNEV